MIQDRSPLETDPAAMLSQFRALGATTVRVIVNWYLLSPDPTSKQMPAGLAPSDPNAYAAAAWAPYDKTVRDAQADGMKVDLTLSGGAPRWAEASGIPPQGFNPNYAWKPNAKLYGEFVHAVGERYSGSFTPTSASAPLPAVHFWALWNEPNFGQDLAPQAINGSTFSLAPTMYRGLVDAGWSGLQQSGHGADTILIGEFAARGLAGPVNFDAKDRVPKKCSANTSTSSPRSRSGGMPTGNTARRYNRSSRRWPFCTACNGQPVVDAMTRTSEGNSVLAPTR